MRSVSRKIVFIKLFVIAIGAVVAIAGLGSFSDKYTKVIASVNGPSPSHTGAPDEANCTACHSDFAVNSGTGSVVIAGVPARYQPNSQVSVTVTTAQMDGAILYGFQLTAVDALGRSIGTFTLPPPTQPPTPPQMQLDKGFVGMNFRKYIEHTSDGTVPTMFGFKSWTFTWNAPAQTAGTVTFYAAGNAANSDGNLGGDYIYTTQARTLAKSAPADFDGDFKTDIGIFRPSLGEWWYLKSSNGQNYAAQFGASTDTLAPGDFTGDGKADIAFWRPSTGFWFVLRSEDSSFFSFPFGATNDVPVQADYDADGKTDAAVYRPSNQTWFISNSSGGTTIQTFGQSGDAPVPADYDGDGKTDIAIFRPSNGQWWLNRSSAGVIAATFGVSTDTPAQGDYTGDGKSDVAFWRPSTGEWFVLRSEDFSYFSFPFGTTGDIPAQGDYDGDAKFDAAVFRPSSNTWFVQRSTAGTLIQGFGQTGDVPIPGN